ncbi:hypothetical protein [Rhodococcus sp. YL-1]
MAVWRRSRSSGQVPSGVFGVFVIRLCVIHFGRHCRVYLPICW